MEREWRSYMKDDIPKGRKKWSEKTPAERQKEWNEKRSKSLQKSLEKKKPDQDKLEKWYKFIFESYKGICQEHGNKLEYNKSCVHHCLEKSKYPYYKFDERNGILISASVHNKIHYGTQNQKDAIKCYPVILKKQITLLDECGLTVKADELRIELTRVANIQQIKIANEDKKGKLEK